MKLVQNEKGGWEVSTPRWKKYAKTLFIIGFLVFVGVGCANSYLNARSLENQGGVGNSGGSTGMVGHGSESPCREIGPSEWDCTDEKTLGRLKELTGNGKQPIEWVYLIKNGKEVKNITAIRTKYSRADSCHYPKVVDGKTWCLTAIGRDTVEGRTVACPRNLKLGTVILIGGKEYVCEDRYNLSLDKKRPLPTFDVFAEAENLSKLPDYKNVTVGILLP